MSIQKFITDNDAFLASYCKLGARSTNVYNVFNGAVPKGTLQFDDAFPEPYYGDPYDSLAVIININPGGAVVSAPPLTGKYSSYAQGFPYLNGGGCIEGQKWWVSRREWMQRLVKIYNGTTASSKMPFALEICPWHSARWKGMKLTADVQTYIRNRVLSPALEAIKHSQLGFGLCVSKTVYNFLRRCGAKVVVDETVWTPSTIASWPTNSNGAKVKRRYSLLSYEWEGTVAYFLCTWAQGGNNAPGSVFEPVEEFIIKDIRKRFIP